jgi:hypothetical protein
VVFDLFGVIACGFVQWAMAAQQPPSLCAIAPATAVYPGVDCPGLRNAQDPRFWFDGVRRQLATTSTTTTFPTHMWIRRAAGPRICCAPLSPAHAGALGRGSRWILGITRTVDRSGGQYDLPDRSAALDRAM